MGLGCLVWSEWLTCRGFSPVLRNELVLGEAVSPWLAGPRCQNTRNGENIVTVQVKRQIGK